MATKPRLFLLDAYALILEAIMPLLKTRESTLKAWTPRPLWAL